MLFKKISYNDTDLIFPLKNVSYQLLSITGHNLDHPLKWWRTGSALDNVSHWENHTNATACSTFASFCFMWHVDAHRGRSSLGWFQCSFWKLTFWDRSSKPLNMFLTILIVSLGGKVLRALSKYTVLAAASKQSNRQCCGVSKCTGDKMYSASSTAQWRKNGCTC